ncbi:Na+-dependent transporters of the SNF family [Slackia heliotrinireducens]|uniref:Transporter n=1 Tax=Slackia heliotrinireducens (strain ATCC 29202 / DSM 20476 / NCTC 11029 / RHS 1) TaxID=471855 RepID=C7N8A9_SLAHD|nr:sodium-dependent transporter [Slackia heliotrinireducens]ACV23144.1 SNF family Na+-dependent transporter [Slackia heliotrinireducens DSM 20476]VEH02184.1 Na+-dependent transporters of the SNF family [Slackia heliotrinireducens]
MAESNLESMTRSSWSGKWAFILAGAASAVGLGNMWRFPYLAAKYGGGMFLLTYLVLVFTFGVSMLLLEITLGRASRQSVIGAYAAFDKRWKPLGFLAAAVPFIITPYYCIIGGWVAKYAASYVLDSPADIASESFFGSFITSEFSSFFWMLLFMAITFVVVALGVKRGIEKVNLVLMPALILMAILLSAYTLTLPGAVDGLLYYVKPDFSKFSPELLVGALGQMFYSLSLAMGIMVTYGSYLLPHEDIVSSATRIGVFDVGVSFLAGLMIVPTSFVALGSGEAVAAKAGPSLMFGTLPTLFESLGAMAPVVGCVFFLLVLFAALTSAISLTEACVSIVSDGTGWSRRKCFIITVAVMVIVGIFVNLGYNRLSFIEPLGDGSTLLDLFDFVSNVVLMPIVALGTCIFVGWVIKPKVLIDEMKEGSALKAEKAWVAMIKFIAPVLIVIILVSYVAAQFGFVSF